MELTAPAVGTDPWVHDEAAIAKRVRRLCEVLEEAKLGADGAEPTPEALSAAESLLDLGFPHAFELTPEQLTALRESQCSNPWWLKAAAAFSVVPVVGCALLNALCLFECGPKHALLSFGICGVSMWVALAAGLQLLRLSGWDSVVQRLATRRLWGWSLAAMGLLWIDLGTSAVLGDRLSFELHGWANAGWILPVTLPMALLSRHRFAR